ncbi:MAG: hypothetical protein C0404_06625 [Verrucomicrobia bacterium]|nr:hypothetical protein [Verrucomicrobiota bacterium]
MSESRIWLIISPLLLVLQFLLHPCSSTAADNPAGGDSRDVKTRISEAIGQLGDHSYQVREAASRRLWAIGDKAQSELERASRSDSPEVAARAGEILDNIKIGLPSDAPPEIVQLVATCRKGNSADKMLALEALLRDGKHGPRIALNLVASERAEVRPSIMNDLYGAVVEAARALVEQGRHEEARAILEPGAKMASRRYVQAFVELAVIRGGVDEEIGRLAGRSGASSNDTFVLSELFRAAGRTNEAIAAAETSGNTNLLTGLLRLQGNWKKLLELHQAKQEQDTRAAYMGEIAWMGLACSYHRLAGQTEDFQRMCVELEVNGRRSRNHMWESVKALLINDAPAPAVRLLQENNEHESVVSLLLTQGKFEEVFAMAEEAKRKRNANAKVVLREAANLAQRLGIRGEIQERIPDIALFPWDRVDHGTVRFEQKDRLSDICLVLYPGRLEESLAWWEFLHARSPDISPRQAFEELESLLLATARVEVIATNVLEAAKMADKLDRGSRTEWLCGITDTCTDTNLFALAIDVLTKALESKTHDPDKLWLRIGDIRAKRNEWQEASRAFHNAAAVARKPELAATLEGIANLRIGRKKDGDALIRRADVMCLGEPYRRCRLAMELMERDHKAESERNDELVMKTADPLCWEASDALNRYARWKAMEDKAYPSAALYTECARLSKFDNGGSFVDVSSYVKTTWWIIRARTFACIAAGQQEEALRLARLGMSFYQADIQLPIEVYKEMQKRGWNDAALKIFEETRKALDELCVKYPKSASFHNEIAWLEACCRQKLDDALTHARRAVELDPKVSAFLDTLGEVHFQRGEGDRALACAKECIKMDPKYEYYQRQLKRIQAGDPSAPLPEN